MKGKPCANAGAGIITHNWVHALSQDTWKDRPPGRPLRRFIMMETWQDVWYWVSGYGTTGITLAALGVAVVAGLLAMVAVRCVQALFR